MVVCLDPGKLPDDLFSEVVPTQVRCYTYTEVDYSYLYRKQLVCAPFFLRNEMSLVFNKDWNMNIILQAQF